MDAIADYSPNIRWGKQHIEIVLRQWDYSAVHTVDVGGNCRGLDVMETAVGVLYDELLSDDDGMACVELTRANGDTLLCSDEEDRGEDWLKKMVVSLTVVGWTAPTLNEVRAMNGAAPVPHGDQPWAPN